ncbi:MAG: C1 family peptidase [Halobacteriota archaeon]
MGVDMPYKMGWLQDLPDNRDFLLSVAPQKLEAVAKTLPPRVDLRNGTPILDQNGFNACVAHAVMGAFMWIMQHTTQTCWVGSRMFVYKLARDMDHIVGDNGATVRSGTKVTGKYGVPHETSWPYVKENIDAQPPQRVFDEAKKAMATNYYRVNVRQTTYDKALIAIKAALQQFPVSFGSMIYDSIFDVGTDGKIPLPSLDQQPAGGHALLALGYDDGIDIQNEKGALLLQNSWGDGWGAKGYGWFPYRYVLAGLTRDLWIIAEEKLLKEKLENTPFEVTEPTFVG